MKLIKHYCFLILICTTVTTFGQSQSPDSTYIRKYSGQLRQMVSYLQFTLNTLGSGQTPTREKEIIIQQSYSKLFLDEKVQIEDDLAGERSTMTNKDVQAYLKDVDFFFKNASFELIVEDISWSRNEDGQGFFTIRLSRHLNATNYQNVKVENVEERFIEVNLDESNEDLKIASVYTHAYSFREEMYVWWNNLSFDWKRFFAPKLQIRTDLSMLQAMQENFRLQIGDTIYLHPEEQGLPIENTHLLADLQSILAIRELDISDNPSINSLEPLSKLTELRSLDISGTTINDLVPIRNLTKLEVLRCNNTLVSDLSPLKYVSQLKELHCNQSRVIEVTIASQLPLLEKLSLNETAVANLRPLAANGNLRELNLAKTRTLHLTGLSGLDQLEILNLEDTKVSDLSPLNGNTHLRVLNINRTLVTDLDPLSGATSLTLLYADQSRITSLSPLLGLKNLSKVYCEQSLVSGMEANTFMRNRPEVLVVFESQSLLQWWADLSPSWQEVFKGSLQLQGNPDRDDLQRLANIKKLSIKGRRDILSLQPVEKLSGLSFLDCANTNIDSLGPLQDLVNLEELHLDSTAVKSLHPIRFLTQMHTLSCQHTAVHSLEDIKRFSSLQTLNISATRVKDLKPLHELDRLRTLKADQSLIRDKDVIDLLAVNSACLVSYKSSQLRAWWRDLGNEWRVLLSKQANISNSPNDAELHQIIQLTSIEITGQDNIRTLNQLDEILQLKELSFSNTRINDLWFLRKHRSLEKLDCSNNPISSLGPLTSLTNLIYINCENTPVEDLEPLASLYRLETLICGGTQIKDLKPLADIHSLTTLDVSNTDIRNLRHIQSLFNLKLLKCYNTKLSSKSVDKFKEGLPELEVVYY